jgi:hypothetical protein
VSGSEVAGDARATSEALVAAPAGTPGKKAKKAKPPKPIKPIKPRRMEKVAVGYFKRRGSSRAPPTSSADAVHFLNPEERKALRRVERMAVLRAAGAGAFAATLGASVSIIARPILGEEPGETTSWQWLEYIVITLMIAIPVAIVELSFVYWNAIASVHKLAEAAGITLFRPDDENADDEDEMFAAVLARAALEIPNPPRPLFGIDPRREASKARLIAATVFYKAKVGVSNFVLRRILVRVFGRAGLRSWIPFISVPVTACWDAFVCRRALREARLRAMGPSAAVEIVEHLLAGRTEVTPTLHEVLLRAVGAAVVRSADFHPNLVAMVEVLQRRLGKRELEGLDESRRCLALLPGLPPDEQKIGLQMLAVACAFDGRIRRKEWEVLAKAYGSTGREVPRAAMHAFRRALMNGDALGVALLGDLVPPPRAA